MNVAVFKTRFEESLQARPSPVDVETVWKVYQHLFAEPLDGETCEEFAVSASVAAQYDGARVIQDETRFQLYFGRLIDFQSGEMARTVEINIYIRYAMNQELQALVDEQEVFNLEDAYCLAEGEAAIRQKLNAVFGFVDRRERLWKIITGLTPLQQEFQFYTW